ncbi:hypothetical protein B0H14DRAFT_3546691 [Mycena olivaceomarginata]|nr:hypothetical protein B0H14DRAFT_3546691 [Mycena olivaceomarginata]
MPESQVLNAFAHRIRLTLEDACRKNDGVWPEGHLRLFPRTFAEGTAAKAHETILVDVGDYTETLEPELVPMNPHDEKRIPHDAPWMYLVNRALLSGPVNVAVRGKCLAPTAGHHALICHFSLEGNMLLLSKADFDEIVSTCVPGNNKNPAKAKRLPSFPLPQRFVLPGARRKAVRKINILATIVMDEDVIILTDFSRMSQVHIMSSSQILQLPDIQPGSLLWETRLWKWFQGGPDWIVETDAALAGLDSWRAKVLKYQLRTPIIEELLDVTGPAAAVQERTKKRGRLRKALSTHKAVDRILHIPQCHVKDRAIHTVNKENDNGA